MAAKKQLPIVTARYGPDKAIGISLINKEKPLYTRCRIKADCISWALELSYYWNGANIPPLLWWFIGLEPLDPRVAIASGFHDKGCEDPNVPQAMADSAFAALLGPIIFNGQLLEGVGRWKTIKCYVGVKFYSLFVRPETRMFFRKES